MKYLKMLVLFLTAISLNVVAKTQSVERTEPNISAENSESQQNELEIAPSIKKPTDKKAECISSIKEQFSSNRHQAIPANILQVAIWYDGNVGSNRETTLAFEVINNEHRTKWIVIGDNGDQFGGITTFDRIVTREYALTNCAPTGKVHIMGVVKNGVIDGMAVGMLYKNQASQYQLLHSANRAPGELNFVGMWPLGMNDERWVKSAPQITGFGMEQLKAILTGAAYLENGVWQLY